MSRINVGELWEEGRGVNPLKPGVQFLPLRKRTASALQRLMVNAMWGNNSGIF
jgi:hypothetical protein